MPHYDICLDQNLVPILEEMRKDERMQIWDENTVYIDLIGHPFPICGQRDSGGQWHYKYVPCIGYK